MGILPISIVGQDSRGLITRFGKYNRFANVGLNFVIPIIEDTRHVNVTEQMVDIGSQEVITKDSLNATIDAQVYFKIKSDDKSVFNSQYNVFNVGVQIVQLAKTSLRNIIGCMKLDEANSSRNKINAELLKILVTETKNWGIEIVRTEIKEISPPEEVQIVMNNVVIAEKQKTAALDLATAAETEADGRKRAAIKNAEGIKQKMILEAEGNANAAIKIAEGQAKAIQLVNEAANQYFVGNAQDLKKLEVAQTVLGQNTKIIVSEGTNLINVLSDATGVPLKIFPMTEDTQPKKKKDDY